VSTTDIGANVASALAGLHGVCFQSDLVAMFDSTRHDESFMPRLLQQVTTDARRSHKNNIDEYRFPQLVSQANRGKRSIENAAALLLDAVGLTYVRRSQSRERADRLGEIVAQANQFDRLYRLLQDEGSRRWLIALLAYRVLGNRHVKLPRNSPEYGAAIRMIRRDLLRWSRVATAPGSVPLDHYDLRRLGVPVQLHAHLLNILNTFVLQQYRLSREGVVIGVFPGDVVIAAGACWGDTALYFADLVGAAGTVI